MPSPLGHALAGIAAGWLVAGRLAPGLHATLFVPGSIRRLGLAASYEVSGVAMEAAALGLAGAAPDLDLLAGTHSTYTHSIGAVAIVYAVAFWFTKRPRVALACAAAWASHLVLDWLGSDSSPPIGIMALWPLSDAYSQSTLHVFDAISRRYWLPREFIAGNVRAAAKEVLLLAPVTWAAYASAVIRRR